MKSKKGFTIVELLGVIVILGILLLIGIPTIRSFIRRGEDVYYSSLEREMASAGGEYLNTYRTLFPRVIGHYKVVSLGELEANNYIDKVVDEDGNKCIGQVVVNKKKNDSYSYTACLKCENRYVTEDAVCIPDEDSDTGFKNNEEDNLYDDKDDYRIIVPQEEYEVGQAEEFIIPEVIVQHKENGVWKDTNNKPVVSTKKVDTTKIGTKTVTYTYHGSKASIKVKVVDKVAPTAPEVVIKYNDQKGNNYQGNWYSGTLYVEYKSTDYTKKNIIGSGIKNYVYSLDGTTWTEVRKDNDKNKEYVDWNIIDANATENKIIPGDGAYTIYVKAIDKAGNESTVSEYVIKIDTTAPECAMKVLSGTVGLEDWYKSKITIGYDESQISGTTSKILTTPVKAVRANGTVIATGAKTVEITTPEENIRVYGSITDEAGNVTVCETPALDGGYRIKLDPSIPKAPTITVTDGNGVGGRWYTGAYTYETTPETGVWHIEDTTMTLSGANNLSKNIYYYAIDQTVQVNGDGRATNAVGTFDNRDVAASDIKAIQSDNTPETTYYMRVCSVAGNCSDNSNYIVRLDKTVPNVPTITANDGNPLGGVWHVNETETSNNCSQSGVWHIENTKLTFDGANNISGNMYYYRTGSGISINSNGRPTNAVDNNSGVSNGVDTTATSNTTSTVYYTKACSVAGKCSDNGTYELKIDKTEPGAPSMTAHDGKGSGAWHNAADVASKSGNVVMTLAGGSNISGNIYWYRDSAEPVVTQGRISTGTKGNFNHGTNTAGTTYYAMTCSVAGKCSASNNYLVKLDKSLPNTPTSTIRQNNASGTVISNANTWKNYNMWWGSFSAADNGPSGTSYYQYSTNCTGTASGNLGESHSYGNGTNYTFCIRSVDVAGNASAWSGAYYFKVDMSAPNVPTSTIRQNNAGGAVVGNTSGWRGYTTWWGSFSASDNGGAGINHYEFSSDGVNKAGNLDTGGYTYGHNTRAVFYIRSVDNAGNPSSWSSAYYFYVDTTAPVVSNFRKINDDVAYLDCSDPESGVTAGTVSTAINAATITATCTNGAGLTNSASHNCSWNGCKTGSNTCAYGCDSVYNSCKTGDPGGACVGGNESYNYSGTCNGHVGETDGNSCCPSNAIHASPHVSCGTGKTPKCKCSCDYDYKCTLTGTRWNNCASKTPNTCVGGYDSVNCSNCKTGSNTCAGGYVW